ncbi:OVARIAN TUMOR DOMAIN-containing deubiquitinating enzyme 3 isoform X2 [Ricinus communis]|uniref:OVARIAN TUMOR DOMAIN-containing deubiquitinating enzyme 3 isoform X2 n=1 Tax=Ricinus communis TaxID=3988 RepID=UPI00201A4729|nr:OVARIAN TUMOR DOMAIN-containing deubiquitinating enzyme 3 isoform X2 [Ricinus communis]
MAAKPVNDKNILEQLKHGVAKFEIVSSPDPSISTWTPFFAHTSHRFFARIGPSLSGSPATKKLERYSVQKVTGDGRCLFRALVKGMALNKGVSLNPREERDDADDLRMAVKEVLCNGDKERRQYEEALIAISVDESLKRYCQRIGRPDFWGGESELLVLSKLCSQPVIVYIPEHEFLTINGKALIKRNDHTRSGWGSGFIPIAEYGTEFRKGMKKGKPRKVVRLLYNGKNHYDLLF